MPLTLTEYSLTQLKDIMSSVPSAVLSGTVELFEGQTFTFKWNENDGHVLTWKEPRK